jgi:hypothetical protein
MNAERLHAIVKSLKKEMDEKTLVSQMQNLVGGLRAVGQQSNTQNQQNLSSYRTSMYQALDNSASDQFSPAWRQLLVEIGGEDFFGAKLRHKIQTTIAENQMTPSVAADQLEALRQRMEKFYNALNQASSAFSTLKISDERLGSGECEVGILIPRGAVHNQLIPFADELHELSFILNTFSEVATSKPDELVIKTISSSGLLVYLLAAPPFAACLAAGVERVVALYKNLLEIRKIQMDIQRLGVPDESTKGIEDYANTHMEKGIENVSVEIVNNFYKGERGRKNELTTAIRFSLNMIANRIDEGYNIEVRAEPLAAADDAKKENAEKKAAIAAVQAASANLQFLKLEGRPILRLPEPEKPQPGQASEKPKRTKTKSEQEEKRKIRLED